MAVRTRWVSGTALLVAVSLAACGPASTPTPTPEMFRPVTGATVQPGAPLPTPAGPVVLTVSGRIDPDRAPGQVAEFDLEGLEALGVVEMGVDDFIATGRSVNFQGVLLRTVLAAVGADPAAETLHALALDDYTVDIPVRDAYDLPVMIATRVDGERMSLEQYGPIRIVYPFGPITLDPVHYALRSIWQLSSIDVR